MQFTSFKLGEIEPRILEYWQTEKIVESLRQKNKDKEKFYFLEGPPYTSGRVHIGTAWQTSMKDIVLRYKRMRGYNVWDRMGYDMHGLPTEQKVMKKLNLKNKEEIETFGVAEFVDECVIFCREMMHKMNQDFTRLGLTLDFSDPYQPIKREFMEAEWFLIKKAHEKGRLYQGLRTMHWDAATQSAVAKHELEYKTLKDTSIYVKFKHNSKENTYFIIWTTTPWTIPLNLAVMVNPELTYVDVKVNDETWIVAKDLLEAVMRKAKIETFSILREYLGIELEGEKYTHPLNVKELLPKDLQTNPKLFSVLLSKEYVENSYGTGIVHCAPGCGPEDYEVGHLNHIPPFNCVDESGLFADFGKFTGWQAKHDDKKFIQTLDDADSLVAKESYVHDYPHGERSHQPVIFRTTKQWFFKVEDLKDQMLEANREISWNPASAKNAFNSWLENLRDNSITKQRYWGTAVPIWQAEDGDYLVVGSVSELEELSGEKVVDMHIPQIDKITIKKDGKVYKRIPDVLDVWIDAGTASWNCLGYPKNKGNFAKFFPADFILEGKDQIRGWFNLLMVASFLAFDKPSFKNVYMNGFVTDIDGVKMSKSLGNIISPDELISKHGADVLRYYMFQTSAGEDINFSWDECKVKERQLNILWNLHILLINLSKEIKVNPFELKREELSEVFGIEEKYILSRLNSTIKEVTSLLETYHLDEMIQPLEDLFLDLSRTYIQLVRDKSSVGNLQEKKVVVFTLSRVLLELIKMLHLVTPFTCEAIYLNLKEEFSLPEKSVSHYAWPTVNEFWLNPSLEEEIEVFKRIVQSALYTREKARLGLRWPVKEVLVVSKNEEVTRAVNNLSSLLCKQINAKKVKLVKKIEGVKETIKPDYAKLGPVYGNLSPQIITKLSQDSSETILSNLERNGSYKFKIEGNEVKITRDMLIIEKQVPEPYLEASWKQGSVFLNTQLNEVLEAEGYSREITRNIQQLRKKAGLQKTDRVNLFLKANEQMVNKLQSFVDEMKEKVGAKEFILTSSDMSKSYQEEDRFKVKQEDFLVCFSRL